MQGGKCISSLRIQKLLKINFVPYRFFRINFYSIKAKGGNSSREEKCH